MTDMGIYSDIASRTRGDIYVGVVGPVRTGKSTLIKRISESLIIPSIETESARERARDEMPQSASGKTVMTTEPKFIPETAATIKLDDGADCRLKLIDCVGYVIPGAMGLIEDGQPRMVMTPWSESPLPFEKAAETGTRKVIEEHSTVGIVVTTDGSIGELPREAYTEAEARVVSELKALGKPFVIVLNCTRPNSPSAQALSRELEETYDVPVLAMSCVDLNDGDIKDILRNLLYEFPVRELRFNLPSWLDVLDESDALRSSLVERITESASSLRRVDEIRDAADALKDESGIDGRLEKLDLGSGRAVISVNVPDKIFYSILGEKSGFEIENERALLTIMTELADVKKKYDKVASAIDDVMNDGYGIVMPSIDDLTLEEPEIVKQPGGYGVKLKASAPSIHMMKADIETEVNPIVGTESQSEELVSFLLKEFEEDPRSIWESNMFGKSLHELVSENLNSKLAHMPDEARAKIAGTIQRIINEGSGGLICILL
ncbi:MAG: stage IV sporulation protein A [Clostridia bacterium]|nr:stage IV sporulation protein A [Clostridia bacterium]